MKVLYPLIVVVLLFIHYASASESSELIMEKEWENYKIQFNKSYPPEEDAERFLIYKQSRKQIDEHNARHAKGEESYTMGLNHMSDWKPEERNRIHGLMDPQPIINQ